MFEPIEISSGGKIPNNKDLYSKLIIIIETLTNINNAITTLLKMKHKWKIKHWSNKLIINLGIVIFHQFGTRNNYDTHFYFLKNNIIHICCYITNKIINKIPNNQQIFYHIIQTRNISSNNAFMTPTVKLKYVFIPCIKDICPKLVIVLKELTNIKNVNTTLLKMNVLT